MVPEDIELIFTNQPLVLTMFVITGLILLLVGYRVFRLYSAAIGLLFGLLVGSYLCYSYNCENIMIVIVLSAGISAIAFWLVYRLGLFATGAAVGYFVGLYLLPNYPIYAYVLAVLVGLMNFFIERIVVVLITSFFGATFITLATHMAITGTTIQKLVADVRGVLDDMFANPYVFILWLSLIATGVVTQLVLLKERVEEESE